MALSKRTRGKTQAGRLWLVDDWCAALFPKQGLTKNSGPPWLVDVGFGEVADTAVELHETLRLRGEDWQLLATDMDVHRVENAAERFGRDDRVFAVQDFRLEKFLELQKLMLPTVNDDNDESSVGATLIRAFNVLRQYQPKECAAVHELLATKLREGGWLVEGTSDRAGDLASFHVFSRRHGRLERTALVFLSSGERGFGPWQFRDVLPQDIRRSVGLGTWLWDFFTAWEDCATQAREARTRRQERVGSSSPLEIFEESVALLRETSWEVHSCSLPSGMAMVLQASLDPLASPLLRRPA
ncbi:MAG: hypothetical protein GY822_09665 [Deltaproteobacteria bacterium]|nr:hypothetical protein [Deltaproteobacteria bacterium]